MLKNYFLNRKLKQLEREGNDDLQQILEFGPGPFSTPELKMLLRRIRRQMNRVALLQKRFFLAGASTVVLTGLSFLAAALGMKMLGIVFLSLSPAGLIAFAVGSIMINRRYRTYRHSRVLERAIREEIDRRRKDASIF